MAHPFEPADKLTGISPNEMSVLLSQGTKTLLEYIVQNSDTNKKKGKQKGARYVDVIRIYYDLQSRKCFEEVTFDKLFCLYKNAQIALYDKKKQEIFPTEKTTGFLEQLRKYSV